MSTAEDDPASEYKISRISFQENPSLSAKRNKSVDVDRHNQS